MAYTFGLTVRQRTKSDENEIEPGASLMILDTMGELAKMYAFCDLAFIGGSLVEDGGHNPLEPAAFSKPVLFGPHMEDFSEISADLLNLGGAMVCAGEEELFIEMEKLLRSADHRQKMGTQGRALVLQHRGVTGRHISLINETLAGRPGKGFIE